MDKQVIKNGEPETLESLMAKKQWEEKVNKELKKISNKYFSKRKKPQRTSQNN